MTGVPIQIVRLSEELPDDFPTLREEARAEGYRLVETFAEEWRAGRYAGPEADHAGFAAFADGRLAALGAITPDPYDPGPDLLRLRHLYVRPPFRRTGVGRVLATSLIQQGLDLAGRLSLRAADERAALFWDSLGFQRVADNPARTHILTR